MTKMSYPNKENNVLILFLNESTKHWHFKDIVKNASISKERANFWLKKLVKGKVINHIKPGGKMPYFQGNWGHPNYYYKKKLYGLNQLYGQGLLTKLLSLEEAKTIIIFGSFARGDWHTKSDIDIFIYGDPGDLKFGTLFAGREVQVHFFKTKKEIKDIKSGLMKNIINGFFVKGSINDIAKVSV
ncbi:hypothetical protein CMO93_01030 [Candidatus Woesearchaeota archaeon]|nr:hypothetical protein [Candidatus Woesearchaeota archaeon]|tara:strand:- start:16117 stop:16671 length:555 start_codon:yes stop_codon:yes gene_type:complete